MTGTHFIFLLTLLVKEANIFTVIELHYKTTSLDVFLFVFRAWLHWTVLCFLCRQV